MLLPTLIHTATVNHFELIDRINITCFKNAEINRISLRNSKALHIYPNAFFFFRVGGKAGLLRLFVQSDFSALNQ